MTHSAAYDYCKSKNMGLAMWHTAELYEDIIYLATKASQNGLLTALTNKDDESCTSKQECHGKLIWRQREKGAEEYFETQVAYDSIQAKNNPADIYTLQIVLKNSTVKWLASHKDSANAICGGE